MEEIKICENCGKQHDGSYGSGRFCCKECARAYSSKQIKKGYKKTTCSKCGAIIYIDKHCSLNRINYCEKCKKEQKNPKVKCRLFNKDCSENCLLYKHNFCNKAKKSIMIKINMLIKYFNLQFINNDEKYILSEFYKIKNMIQQDIDNGLSCVDVCKKYTNTNTLCTTIFKMLNIKTRNLAEACKNTIYMNKLIPPGPKSYKRELHKTWNNKEYFLRSSYESDYANQLDMYHIDYIVEPFRILYYDTNKNSTRVAIPDFYLTYSNTIVEIKSVYTLDIQNMKDKIIAYKNLGYNFKLILEHQNVDINKIQKINSHKFILLDNI